MKRYFLIIAACCATVLIAIWVMPSLGRTDHLANVRPAEVREIPAIVRALRPNYPYSVIPGGVYSPAELGAALARDVIARDHYAGFDTRAARLVLTTTSQRVYLSYRMNGRVYWTRRALPLPQGEFLLTDGKSYARARCGNRLSAHAGGPTGSHEPDVAQLLLPPFDYALLKSGKVTFVAPPDINQVPENEGVLHIPRSGTQLKMPLPSDSGSSGNITTRWSGPWIGVAPPWPIFGMLTDLNASASGTSPKPGGAGGSGTTPQPPSNITETPEPRALTWFGACLFGSAWGLLRLQRRRARLQVGSTNPSTFTE